MSLREDMWRYEQITGESAEHVPIIKLGAFLDGYEMGLKVLEQQLCDCDDYISRVYIEPIVEELENICINGDEHILSLLSDIKNAPPVTPQTRWIPVSERLPEDGQKVLVTTRSCNLLEIDTCIFHHASAFWKHYVIAWMPLPQPYKEGEKDDE